MFWCQHITHLRTLLKNIYWKKRNCLLWKGSTVGKKFAASPGYGARSPYAWATWLCRPYSVGDIMVRKDGAWNFWQAPVVKSQCGNLEFWSKTMPCTRENCMSSEKPQGFWIKIMLHKAGNYTPLEHQLVECYWKPRKDRTLTMGIKWPWIWNSSLKARSVHQQVISLGRPISNLTKDRSSISQIEHVKDAIKAQETHINKESSHDDIHYYCTSAFPRAYNYGHIRVPIGWAEEGGQSQNLDYEYVGSIHECEPIYRC